MTASLVALGMVLVGLGDMPYGYYMLLRLVLCGICLFHLLGGHPPASDWQRWVTGGFAVLYNPIVPIQLGDKDLWIVINFLTVGWLFFIERQSKTSAGVRT
ncbi:MAG: hypothetical protein ABS36_05125 [Acidobacteria bacterium SCN 69-37]|nr:MAG: hypothetical protein ABS36_05125 [Acidobacteria bacterium SCN 69-37]